MKKEIIISGLVGLLVGILVFFFFGMWGWNRIGWCPMTGGINMDRHFIEQMIPHHDDAILMAEVALAKAEHQEIRQLAQNIKRTQSEENEKMREWYRLWYGTDVPDNHQFMDMGGGMMMQGGTMGDATDISRLESAKPFDKEFIEQMIPHHQMAIMMATMLLPEREEVKTLATAIIDAQSKEIDQMRSWYSSWYGQ